MNNALAIQDNLREMTSVDQQAFILAYVKEMGREIERPQMVKKMLYAIDNGYPLSLAVTGGLYIVAKGKVEVEARPLKHRIAHDHNYHLQTIEAKPTTNTKHLYRRASDLWPFYLSDKDAVIGDWVKVGESTFTMADAKKIISDGKGGKLGDKQTYNNFPARMLDYRNTMRIVSLYGDGLFASPTYYAGEISNGGIVQDDIIEGVEVEPVIDLDKLVEKYDGDFEFVMQGMAAVGNDTAALNAWLEENKDD